MKVPFLVAILAFFPAKALGNGLVLGAVSLGPRPFFLLNEMRNNSVKDKLSK
jgi:hypothetical protein